MHVSCVEGFHGVNEMIFLFCMPEGWTWMKECVFRTTQPQGMAHTSSNTRSIPTPSQRQGKNTSIVFSHVFNSIIIHA